MKKTKLTLEKYLDLEIKGLNKLLKKYHADIKKIGPITKNTNLFTVKDFKSNLKFIKLEVAIQGWNNTQREKEILEKYLTRWRQNHE